LRTRPFVVAWVRAVAEARPRYRPRNFVQIAVRDESGKVRNGEGFWTPA